MKFITNNALITCVSNTLSNAFIFIYLLYLFNFVHASGLNSAVYKIQMFHSSAIPNQNHHRKVTSVHLDRNLTSFHRLGKPHRYQILMGTKLLKCFDRVIKVLFTSLSPFLN